MGSRLRAAHDISDSSVTTSGCEQSPGDSFYAFCQLNEDQRQEIIAAAARDELHKQTLLAKVKVLKENVLEAKAAAAAAAGKDEDKEEEAGGVPVTKKDSPITVPHLSINKLMEACKQEVTKKKGVETETSTTRPVEYMGSFSVIGDNQSCRAEYVRKQLNLMREVQKLKPVLLSISLSGVKVSSLTGETIFMAHALKRISYSASDPENHQFSLLAREPRGRTDVQYCHAFRTHDSREAEELNAIIGNAFNVAYAIETNPRFQENGQPQPSFNELIEQQIEVQKKEISDRLKNEEKRLQNRLSMISTARVSERSAELKEARVRRKEYDNEREREAAERDRERLLEGKDRTNWAKQIISKAKHWSPIEQIDCPHETTHNNYNTGSPVTQLKLKIDAHFRHASGCGCKLDTLCPSVLTPSAVTLGLGIGSGITARDNSPMRRMERSNSGCSNTSNSSSSNDSPVVVRLRKHRDGVDTVMAHNASRPLSTRYQNLEITPGPTPNIEDLKLDDYINSIDCQLKQAEWYQAGLPRDEVLSRLEKQDEGSFAIRSSSTHNDCFALSVKVSKDCISHYLITRTPQGCFRVKGVDKEWPTLTALITHHTIMPELLPCPLKLNRISRNPSFAISNDITDTV